MFSLIPPLVVQTLKRWRFTPLLLACVAIAVFLLAMPCNAEGLDDYQNTDFIQLEGVDMFTPQYAAMHDALFRNPTKDEYEAEQLTRLAGIDQDSKVLEVGSGTGHRVALLQQTGCAATGIDSAQSMVAKASSIYPSCKFVHDDILNTRRLTGQGGYTHIALLYFSVYRFQDKPRLFRILHGMLAPGGKLAVHLVNRDKFDPIIPAANPLLGVSAQDYAKSRLTRSAVVFTTVDYVANLEIPQSGDKYVFVETITPKSGGAPVQNRHNLYMPRQKRVLADARDVGFTLVERYDLAPVHYDHHQIYILQKDN